jgi:hypothetical protein
MKKIFRNSGVFKEVEDRTFWVLQNPEGKYYESFKQEFGYWGLSFTDKIESASPWETKKKALAWLRKENASHHYGLFPIKVLQRKIISYNVM